MHYRSADELVRRKMTELMMYTVMLLMLMKPQSSLAVDKHLQSRDLHVDVSVIPPAPQLMFVGTRMTISVVVTAVDNSTCYAQCPTCDAPTVTMSFSSRRPKTVLVETPLSPDSANDTVTALSLPLNDSAALVVDALSVGRAVLVLEISTASPYLDRHNKIVMSVNRGLDVRYTAVQEEVGSSESAAGTQTSNADGGRQLIPRSSRSRLLAVIEYHITVARHRRPIDDGFFWTVAAATLLNAFGLGCVTVYNDARKELRKLQPSVLATLLCQFVVLPPVC